MSDDDDLASINVRIAALRRLLGHDHRDDVFWATVGFSAAQAQQRKHRLRLIAHELHVERAARRGRVHGLRAAGAS